MKKAEETFQLVAKERTGKERRSAVYYHLEKFTVKVVLQHKRSLINDYALPRENFEAFIFNLNLENTTNLFSQNGYRLDERHNTETYTKPGHAKITVHMYFNYSAMLTATMRLEDDAHLQTLTKEQVNVVRDNARDSLDIMAELTKAVKNRHEELNREFEQHATKLCQIEHVTTLTVEQLQSVLQACEKIAAELDIYQEDIVDKRFLRIRRRAEQIMLHYQREKSKTHNAKNDETEEITNDTPLVVSSMPQVTLATVAVKSKVEDNIEDIKARVRQCISDSYEKDDIQKIINLEKEKESIKEELLVVFFEADNNPKLIKGIAALEKIVDQLDSLEKRFKEFALSASFAHVKALYPHVASVIGPAFYHDLLDQYSMSVDSSQKDIAGQVEICQFLYENSPIYRRIIAIYGEILRTTVDGNQNVLYATTMLACLIFTNNFELFKILMEQYGNPNIIGLQVGQSAISLLDVACDLNYDDSRFVEYLLDKGAKIDFMTGSIVICIEATTQNLRNLRTAIQSNSRQGLFFTGNNVTNQNAQSRQDVGQDVVLDRYTTIINKGCTLARYLAAANCDVELVRKISARTSVGNLFLSLTRFSVLPKSNVVMLPTVERLGIELHRTRADRLQRMSAFDASAITHYMSFFMGCENREGFAILQAIFNEFQGKMRNVSDNVLQEIKRSFDAKLASSNMDLRNAMMFQRAKLFVLGYCNSSFQAQQEIIHALLCFKTLCLQSSDRMFSQDNKKAQQQVCDDSVINLLRTSIFKDQLFTWCKSSNYISEEKQATSEDNKRPAPKLFSH